MLNKETTGHNNLSENKQQEGLASVSLFFYPPLTGSKTPTSRFKRNEKDKWDITASKCPILLNERSVGDERKPPLIEVSLYLSCIDHIFTVCSCYFRQFPLYYE